MTNRVNFILNHFTLFAIICLALSCKPGYKSTPVETRQIVLARIAYDLWRISSGSGALPDSLEKVDKDLEEWVLKDVNYDKDGLFSIRRLDGTICGAIAATRVKVRIDRSGRGAVLVISNTFELFSVRDYPTEDGGQAVEIKTKDMQGSLPVVKL